MCHGEVRGFCRATNHGTSRPSWLPLDKLGVAPQGDKTYLFIDSASISEEAVLPAFFAMTVGEAVGFVAEPHEEEKGGGILRERYGLR